MSGKSERKLKKQIRQEIIVQYDEYWGYVIEMPFHLRLLYCWHVLKRSGKHGRKDRQPGIIYPPEDI